MSATVVYISQPDAITKLYEIGIFIIHTNCIIILYCRSKVSIPTGERYAKPYFIVHYQWKYFFICDAIHITNDDEFLSTLHYPCEKFPEKRKRRIGDDKVCLIPQLSDFFAAKIAVTVQVFPFKVVYVDAPIATFVFLQYEYLTFDGSFSAIKLRSVLFEQRRLVRCLVFFAFWSITRGNQFL